MSIFSSSKSVSVVPGGSGGGKKGFTLVRDSKDVPFVESTNITEILGGSFFFKISNIHANKSK